LHGFSGARPQILAPGKSFYQPGWRSFLIALFALESAGNDSGFPSAEVILTGHKMFDKQDKTATSNGVF